MTHDDVSAEVAQPLRLWSRQAGTPVVRCAGLETKRTMSNERSDGSVQMSPARPAHQRLGIVVVTHNRVESLLTTLRRLTALPEGFPIVVVDNASTDGTTEAVRREFPGIEVIERSDNMGAVARNDGVWRLERDYIAFADDDSWWTQGSLPQAIEIFDQHPALALIMSRILVGPEERLDPCCELMSRSPLPNTCDTPGVPVLGFMACGAIVRRSAFLEVGGFHEWFRSSGEEALVAIDLARRGWALSYLDSITSHHHPSKSRNMQQRRLYGITIDLWLTWLRRRPRRVAKVTAAQMRRALTDADQRHGLLTATRRLPAILRQRRVIPPELEEQLTLLDRQNGTA